jgi:hypothetical protein
MESRNDLPLLGFVRRPPKPCPASAGVVKVCRERASKRWSALLTQAKSRIGFKFGMRKRLGGVHWAAFVKYAESRHKAAFFRALTPPSGVLCCEGRLDGGPCPKRLQLDLKSVSIHECGEALPALHLDHTHDVNRICRVWSDALPAEPRSWDDGVCGPLVAHLLFGTEDHVVAQCSARPLWRRQLLLRCGNVRGVAGQDADTFCHDVANAHYDHTLRVKDIAWPGE